MRTLRRILLGLVALGALLAWLWGASVRAAPEVRRRKRERRAARRSAADT